MPLTLYRNKLTKELVSTEATEGYVPELWDKLITGEKAKIPEGAIGWNDQSNSWNIDQSIIAEQAQQARAGALSDAEWVARLEEVEARLQALEQKVSG